MSKNQWEENVLYSSPGGYIQVKNRRGNPGFFYAERKGVDSCAFILYDPHRRPDKPYGLVSERKDGLDARYKQDVFLTTAFGGSNDYHLVPLATYLSMSDAEQAEHFARNLVLEEVLEESGFRFANVEQLRSDPAKLNKIVQYMGKYFVSTQMNQFCFLYLVDVSEAQEGAPTTTDYFELMATTVWMSKEEVLTQTQDWKSQIIVNKHIVNSRH
eukprot:GEZU01036788.1.p1 GENE.GEZU01036788.1~~GEZU01036788.1.p1  ORF type:complete len:214 (-),score=45.58 GEZU01036788.1:36-677(-)